MRENSRAWFAILVVVAVTAVMTPAIVLAAGGSGQGFDAIVRAIETRYHVHATRIPFMGLISCVAGAYTHGGVRGLHVAEIEHLEGPVDGDELNTLVAERVGQGWQRMIRETDRNGGEQSLIYVRPEGNRMGMLIVERSNDEMNIVQLSADPKNLADEIDKHHHHDHNEDAENSQTGGESE